VLFTEPSFLFLFLPVLLALYFLPTLKGSAYAKRPHGGYANLLLLAASVLFYARGGGAFTWLMLGSIAFNYFMAIAVARDRSKAWLAAAIAVNLGVLGVFKYANFFADNVNALLVALHVGPVAVPNVLLPIGISFYTFHAISYVVDVYRGDATAQKSPIHAALYLLLFPQLIAGPIIRYREIAGQLARRVVGLDDFAERDGAADLLALVEVVREILRDRARDDRDDAGVGLAAVRGRAHDGEVASSDGTGDVELPAARRRIRAGVRDVSAHAALRIRDRDDPAERAVAPHLDLHGLALAARGEEHGAHQRAA